MAFRVAQIKLRHIKMPLVHFFETSFSRTYERDIILVEAVSDGVSGWGEVTAGENPFYNEEWTASIWPLLQHYIAPRILNVDLNSAEDVYPRLQHIRGHNMTKGGLEAAVWDLQARLNGNPLWKEIGAGARREIPCGVSIGIQNSVAQLLEKIEAELAAGYQRIKMKIKPGWDVDVIRDVRKRFPDTLLMADANSAYTLRDRDHLRQLDEFNLMMIEQPLAHDDIIDHAVLQASLQTPICLDECIRSAHHAEQAIQMNAAASSISSWGASEDSLKRNASMMFVRRARFRSGAAECWKRHRARPQYCTFNTAEFCFARRCFRQQAVLEAGYRKAGDRSERPRHHYSHRQAGLRVRTRLGISG